ncbi:sugar transporter [Bacteroidia bacterium]|nr:sugar transporter [Bacteroidia bacterium]GHT27012.1 sugar transporter [Bacteroidia bacterium]
MVIALLLSGCGSKKDIVYFQGLEELDEEIYSDKTNYTTRILPNDNLFITVSALNPQVAEPYNVINMSRGNITTTSMEWQGYLVDENGDINFPILGKVHIGGLSKAEAIELLQKRISEDIEDPIVNIRYLNYKISVLGEVNRPGSFPISDEKVSILRAIALAGDLTIYGERRNVWVCRVENGKKQYYKIDLTSPEVFYSPCFYLQQNDIVYVIPNKTKAGSSTYNQNLPLLVSLISVVITAAALFIRYK